MANGANGSDGGAGGGGGALGAGGGVSAWQTSSSTFENCTFTGCIAQGGNGGNAGGNGNGGIGGQNTPAFGSGGDGGDVGFFVNENAGQPNLGGAGGGGGFNTSFLFGGPGNGSEGELFGGDGGDGVTGPVGGGGGGGAAGFGGAFFSRAGNHLFRHCTFSGNQALPGDPGLSNAGTAAQGGRGRGGAIGTFGGSVALDNCILFGNVAQESPVADEEDLYLHNNGPILSDIGHNIIGAMANAGETVFAATSTGNQIGVDPLLLPLGDYGGPTDAFMISACDPAISPALDAGADLGVAEDQRGELRDASPDIGAIEGPTPVQLESIAEQVCPGESVEVTLSWPDATTTWPDGTVGETWDAPEGSYVATVTTALGWEEEVAIEITAVPIVAPALGPDTTVCPGEPVLFDAGNPGAQYSWSSGGLGQLELMADSGLVEVTVSLQGCTESDSIRVEWSDTYPVDLGLDQVLCFGEVITLDASIPFWQGLPPTFQWDGGSVTPELEVDSPGVYSVTATLNGCESSDQLTISQSALVPLDLGPDSRYRE